MFEVYKKTLFYVPKEKYLAIVAIMFSVFSVLFTAVSYLWLNKFLENLIVSGNLSQSKNYALLIFGGMALSFILYMLSCIFSHILGFRLESNLRKHGIDGIMKSSFRFFDLNSSGKIRKIIDDNASQTHNIIAHLIPDNAGAIIMLILVLILGFYIDLKAGIALLILVLLCGKLLMLMTGNTTFMRIYQESLEKLSAETVEYVRGMQVVKIFGANILSFKTLYKAIKDYAKYALNYSMSCKKAFVFFQWFFFGFIAFIVPVAFLILDLHNNPKLIATQLIMVFFLSGVSFSMFMKVMHIFMYSYQGTFAVNKLEELFDEMQKDKLSFGNKNKLKNTDIEFDDVTFSYTKGHPVIKNLSFKLQAGKTYALVGASGSGKSTIAKLISGFYKTDSGHIKIGGEKLESYTEEAITKNIAFVFQNAQLFKTSIYENVKLANPNASHQEVMQALKLAGCIDIIEKFKNKENTLIGAQGVYLSGGEKERIAIARAILKDAKIIIMDEASAAVDPENEYELQKAFANLMRGKTVIMIAHRLTSIKNADEILVLKDGKITERGNHKKLISCNSLYNNLQKLYSNANEWRVKA